MEIDPFDERKLYNGRTNGNEAVSTTISTIIVHGGPLELVIALLRVRITKIIDISKFDLTHFILRVLNLQ